MQMRMGCAFLMIKVNSMSNVHLKAMDTVGTVVQVEADIEVADAAAEVDADKDNAANKAAIFIKPWAMMMTISAMNLQT